MCTFNTVTLLSVTFYLNGGLYAVSVGTDVKFWTVLFLKIESKPDFGFPDIPSYRSFGRRAQTFKTRRTTFQTKTRP